MPSNTLAATIQPQLGAHMIMNGTGKPTDHPNTSIRFAAPNVGELAGDQIGDRLDDAEADDERDDDVVEASWNSSVPISGTTVRSSPTMPPTKALISTSSANCCQFSRRPSVMPARLELADRSGAAYSAAAA